MYRQMVPMNTQTSTTQYEVTYVSLIFLECLEKAATIYRQLAAMLPSN